MKRGASGQNGAPVRNFLPCSGQAFGGGKRHWGIFSPAGPAWWRLEGKGGRRRLFTSMWAADRVAIRLEGILLPPTIEAWQDFKPRP